jgi:hypothetical protein
LHRAIKYYGERVGRRVSKSIESFSIAPFDILLKLWDEQCSPYLTRVRQKNVSNIKRKD